MNASIHRLDISDIDDILGLLRDTWPQLYEATGCPVFDAGYLRWLYDGPAADRHILLGTRDPSGRLIGFKSYLFRRMQLSGQMLDGFITTHLAIRPTVDLGSRIALARELGKIHSLGIVPDSLNLAVFEADKTLARNALRTAEKAGIGVHEVRFHQFIVNSRRLRAVEADLSAIRLQPLDDSGASALAVLAVKSLAPSVLGWTPTAAELAHHAQAAPGGLALAAWRGETCVGGIVAYALGWQKDGAVSAMLVCDMLLAQDNDTMTSLMRAALDYATEKGLRGVVVECADHLNDAMKTAGGLLKSPRGMLLAIRSSQQDRPSPTALRCDIK